MSGVLTTCCYHSWDSANRLWKELNSWSVLSGKAFNLKPECECDSNFVAQHQVNNIAKKQFHLNANFAITSKFKPTDMAKNRYKMPPLLSSFWNCFSSFTERKEDIFLNILVLLHCLNWREEWFYSKHLLIMRGCQDKESYWIHVTWLKINTENHLAVKG